MREAIYQHVIVRIGPSLFSLGWPASIYLGLWLSSNDVIEGWPEWSRSAAIIWMVLCTVYAASGYYLENIRPRLRAPVAPASGIILLLWSALTQEETLNLWEACGSIVLYWIAHWETQGHRAWTLFSSNPLETLQKGQEQLNRRKIEAIKHYFIWKVCASNGTPINLARNVYVEFEQPPAPAGAARVPRVAIPRMNQTEE